MLLSEMSVDQEVETLEKRNKVYKSFFRQELQIQKPRNVVFSQIPVDQEVEMLKRKV